MRRLSKKLLPIVLCLHLTSVGFVQQEIVDDFQGVIDTFSGLCNAPGAGSLPGFVSTICSTLPSLERAADVANSLVTDFGGITEEVLLDTFGVVAAETGWQVGTADITALIGDVVGEVESGTLSARALAGQVLSKVNQQAYAQLFAAPEENAPTTEKEVAAAIKNDPDRVAAELRALGKRSDAVLRSATAADLADEARGAAATSLARGDEEALLNSVTTLDQSGTADRAQALGTNAVSTRAAVQALVDGYAEQMRQQVVQTNNLVTAVKEQALQQVYTTQQLVGLQRSLNEQNLRDYEAWRQDYYDEVAQSTAATRELNLNYSAVAGAIRGVTAPAGGAQ